MVEKLFELSERRKVAFTLLDGYGRSIVLQGKDREAVVSAVSAILAGERPRVHSPKQGAREEL